MKKIIHKLKKNRLVSKITCFSVILMILISSLTVSSFAADEDVSAANEEVNSITDTWTSILNWITSSLGSAQNIFFTSGGSSFVVDSSNLFELGGRYFVALPDFSPTAAEIGSVYSFTFLDSSYYLAYTIDDYGDSFFINSVDDSFVLIKYFSDPGSDPGPFLDGVWYLTLAEPFSGTATLTTPFSGSPQLTFLGTLSVVGVAIAIILLLISVVINFLKLRG